MTDITNVVVQTRAVSMLCLPSTAIANASHQSADYQKRRRYYQQIRARFALPGDKTMCAYCGVREHTALLHEHDFKRAGTGVSVHCPFLNTIHSSSIV
jgi:hypothetical protein